MISRLLNRIEKDGHTNDVLAELLRLRRGRPPRHGYPGDWTNRLLGRIHRRVGRKVRARLGK